jgi:hypothetical protein
MTPDESKATPNVRPSAEERWRRLLQAVEDFIGEFSKESDRAAVILVGARLDYLLSALLSRFLLPNTGSSDELLDTDRALGTFSARIHVACRLGLIDADFARVLHIFRRLRNTFAHETVGISLDHGPSRDRIRELIAPLAHFAQFQWLRERYFKDKPETAADFFTVSALLVARLELACSVVDRVTSSTAILIPPGWKTAEEDNV